MRKTQEVEGLRFAAATVSPIPLREAAELDNSRFVGVQLQPKLRESLAKFCQKPLCFVTMLESRNKV